jgi:hypothetical protein
MEAPNEQGMAQAQAPGGQPQSGGVQEVILQTDQNLSKLAAALSQAQGIPPGLADAMAQVRQSFAAVVDQLIGGGGPQPAEQGSASMEQGASGAVPFSHAGAK